MKLDALEVELSSRYDESELWWSQPKPQLHTNIDEMILTSMYERSYENAAISWPCFITTLNT